MRHNYSMHANNKTTLQDESAFRREWGKGLKVDVSSFALASVENADRDSTVCKGLTIPHNGSKEQHTFSVEKRTFIRIRSRKENPVRMIQPAIKVLVAPSDFEGRTLEQHRASISRLQSFYDAKNNAEIAKFEREYNVDNSTYVEPPYRDNYQTRGEQSEGYTMLLSWIQAQKGQFQDNDSDDSDDSDDY